LRQFVSIEQASRPRIRLAAKLDAVADGRFELPEDEEGDTDG
jgi:hypothetical protein